jgi:hypothetical protein
MASRWFVNKCGGTTLAFRELVELARNGGLSEDDLVKADWQPEWQRAGAVIGLFHYARRTEPEPEITPASCDLQALPVSSSATNDSAFLFDELTAELPLEAVDETEPVPVADPKWMQRYRQVTEERALRTMSPATANEPSDMAILADAAVRACENHSADRNRSLVLRHRWNRFQEFIRSPFLFRLVAGVLIALLVSSVLADRARQAALRFPKPGMPERYLVPVIGECNPSEFAFVLFDVAIVAAVLGYWGAKRVEALAESR